MSETEPTKKKGSVKPRLNLTKKKTAKEQAEPIVSENVVPVLSEIAVPAVAVYELGNSPGSNCAPQT